MLTEEFIPITADNVLEFLHQRYGQDCERVHGERRHQPRWPFPGTVELWIPNDQGDEDYVLAHALNVSTLGIGIMSDEQIAPNTQVSLAIHQPEATLFGRATVRHVTDTVDGAVIGLRFHY
jgi:hypothetical protein